MATRRSFIRLALKMAWFLLKKPMKEGGNAIDAAVTVGFTLAVTLPRAGNLGGGGFMLVHLAKEQQTLALDYREMAPGYAHRRRQLRPVLAPGRESDSVELEPP